VSGLEADAGQRPIDSRQVIIIETYLDNLLRSKGKPVLTWTDSSLTVEEILGDCRSKSSFTSAHHSLRQCMARCLLADASLARRAATVFEKRALCWLQPTRA